jgi:ribokinase
VSDPGGGDGEAIKGISTMFDVTSVLHSWRDHDGAPIAVVGSANADLTMRTATLPRPGETVIGSEIRVLPGGKSANQAVQAALLGASVAFVGAVGDDENGRLIRDAMETAGVDLHHCGVSPRRTGAAIIAVDHEGENIIIVDPGANSDVDAALVRGNAPVIEKAGVLGLCLESPLPGVVAAAEIARRAGTTTILNASPITTLPRELLRIVDVVIVNEGELGQMLGVSVDGPRFASDADHRSETVRLLEQIGIRSAIITLGAHGSVVVEGGSARVVPGLAVDVVDTTGCGDSFFGAVLAASAAGASLWESAQIASVVSGFAATGEGAQSSYADTAALAAHAASTSGSHISPAVAGQASTGSLVSTPMWVPLSGRGRAER